MAEIASPTCRCSASGRSRRPQPSEAPSSASPSRCSSAACGSSSPAGACRSAGPTRRARRGSSAWRVLARPAVYGALARLVDTDRLVAGSVRGFPGPDDRLTERLRRRPSAPLAAVVARRLHGLDLERLDARARVGEEIAALLSPRLARPGADAVGQTHWVFPVVPPDPQHSSPRCGGPASTPRGARQSIGVVTAPEGRPELEAREASETMRDVVFLPVYPELNAGCAAQARRDRQRLARRERRRWS